mmetsp:Transcript_12966/g.23488  ORF Transcript_12966/g.23488 Transcript_12966/m.23488 type:complete len:608 (-) Transcript_12966:294-2117(-)
MWEDTAVAAIDCKRIALLKRSIRCFWLQSMYIVLLLIPSIVAVQVLDPYHSVGTSQRSHGNYNLTREENLILRKVNADGTRKTNQYNGWDSDVSSRDHEGDTQILNISEDIDQQRTTEGSSLPAQNNAIKSSTSDVLSRVNLGVPPGSRSMASRLWRNLKQHRLRNQVNHRPVRSCVSLDFGSQAETLLENRPLWMSPSPSLNQSPTLTVGLASERIRAAPAAAAEIVMGRLEQLKNTTSGVASQKSIHRDESSFSTQQHQTAKERRIQQHGRSSPTTTNSIFHESLGEGGGITISIDPSGAKIITTGAFKGSVSLLNACTGTLRLIGPLIVARRALNECYYFLFDYFTGRYLRTTYTRVERLYLRFVEKPAALRSLARTSSQLCITFLLSKVMGWLVGIHHAPCHSDGRGLAFFCGILWIGTVLGTSYACTTAVSLWGGPLRLQAVSQPKHRKGRRWSVLNMLENPAGFFSNGGRKPQPFNPDPSIFPATWMILRLLQVLTVAIVLQTEPSQYTWCPAEMKQIPKLMRQFLFQLALGDEWYRVLFNEKRLFLGIIFALAYFCAMSWLVVTSATMNGLASLLMIPSLLAVIISAWMNIVIFVNRMEK